MPSVTNSAAWTFHAPEGEAYIRGTASKRGLIDLLAAAAAYLDGSQADAAGHVQAARPHLEAGDAAAVLHAVGAELAEIAAGQSQFADAIDDFDGRCLAPLRARMQTGSL